MQIDLDTLRDAVKRGVLTDREAQTLWAHLEADHAQAGDAPPAGHAAARVAPPVPPWRPALGALAVAVVSAFALLIAFELYGLAGLAVAAATLSVSLMAAGRRRA